MVSSRVKKANGNNIMKTIHESVQQSSIRSANISCLPCLFPPKFICNVFKKIKTHYNCHLWLCELYKLLIRNTETVSKTTHRTETLSYVMSYVLQIASGSLFSPPPPTPTIFLSPKEIQMGPLHHHILDCLSQGIKSRLLHMQMICSWPKLPPGRCLWTEHCSSEAIISFVSDCSTVFTDLNP